MYPSSPARAVVAFLGLTLGVLALLTAPVAAASKHVEDGPPLNPLCLPQLAGTTGIYGTDGNLPTLSGLTGQGAFGPDASKSLRLPERIWFTDTRDTVSNDWLLALRNGNLYARAGSQGVAKKGSRWRQVRLPDCLAGKITRISADHGLLIAEADDHQVFSTTMPGGDLSPERWTWRWGPYLWTGLGVKLPTDVDRFATSDFGGSATFTDSAGRTHHPIGVATVYLMRNGGRTITYLDPWLPSDESREVCLPESGTAQLAGMDASGSTVLAVTRAGRIYTRMYDFDVTGANTVFGSYTWQRGLPADTEAWQLPIRDWKRQPKPPGAITNRVAVIDTGTDAADRQLRVEGVRKGKVGFWFKKIDAPRWSFAAIGGKLTGSTLPWKVKPIERLTRRYEGTMGGKRAVIPAFDWACSAPTKVWVNLGGGVGLTLILHAYDGMRQSPRARGLDDHPREYNAAIEVPAATWASLAKADPRVRAWVDANLAGRITVSPISVTATRFRFLAPCWNLTLNGKPARADALPVPPDPGVLLGRLTEMVKDGRTPGACLLTSPPLG